MVRINVDIIENLYLLTFHSLIDIIEHLLMFRINIDIIEHLSLLMFYSIIDTRTFTDVKLAQLQFCV